MRNMMSCLSAFMMFREVSIPSLCTTATKQPLDAASARRTLWGIKIQRTSSGCRVPQFRVRQPPEERDRRAVVG